MCDVQETFFETTIQLSSAFRSKCKYHLIGARKCLHHVTDDAMR